MSGMVLQLTGTVIDGSPKNDMIVYPNRTLQIPKGADFEIQLTLVDSAGVPIAIALPNSVILSADRALNPYMPALRLTAVATTGGAPNCVSFVGTPDATKFLDPGRYWYDVWVTLGGARHQVVQPSILHLRPTLNLP